MNRQLHKLIRLVLGGLLRITPTFRHVVVHGWPDTEGNSVEVLRYLIRNYSGRIFWLVSLPEKELSWLIADIDGHQRVIYLKKERWRSLFYYLTAEGVFFTHGLYLSPSPGYGRTIVNLWHGDGPKKTENGRFKIEASASMLVSGTTLWGENKRHYFGMSASELAVVGNPRIDQFLRPASNMALEALGLDAARPLVIWLPTYRETSLKKSIAFQDAEQLSANMEIRSALCSMATVAAQLGIQIVLKPHPSEADEYRDIDIKIVSDADLRATKICFYQLVARSNALITDYSSIWTDYLSLNRPIGFFCPDLAEYEKKRGFNVPDFKALLPGPLFRTETDIVLFLQSVVAGNNASEQRKKSAALIGAVTELGACDRLFLAINRRRLYQGLATLTEGPVTS